MESGPDPGLESADAPTAFIPCEHFARRDLFLGRTTEKLECAGCHGPLAEGNGPSFVKQDVYNEVVFGGNPSERPLRIEA